MVQEERGNPIAGVQVDLVSSREDGRTRDEIPSALSDSKQIV